MDSIKYQQIKKKISTPVAFC